MEINGQLSVFINEQVRIVTLYELDVLVTHILTVLRRSGGVLVGTLCCYHYTHDAK